MLEDSTGNSQSYDNQQLASIIKDLPSIGFKLRSISSVILTNPYFLGFITILLLTVSVVSIQRFRTVGGFDKEKVIEDMVRISENEVWEENDRVSYGITANFFDQTKGPVPIIYYPDKLSSSETMTFTLADRSFSTLGFVSKPDEDNHATFRFQIGGEKCTIFAYAFAIPNPEARGGQENLSMTFIIRNPWGNLENLNRFLNEMLTHSRRIRDLIQTGTDTKIVQKEMENLRNYYTRAMLAFRQKYRKEFVM